MIDGRPPETFASGHLRGLDQRGPGRPLRRVRRRRRPPGPAGRGGRRRGPRDRGQGAPGPHRLRPRPRRGRRRRAAPRRRAPTSPLEPRGSRRRDLASWRDDEPSLQIVDVRNPSEQEAGVVPGAMRASRWPGSSTATGELDPTAPDRRVLRRRLPVLDRRVAAALGGLHAGRRPPGRLRRLGRRRPADRPPRNRRLSAAAGETAIVDAVSALVVSHVTEPITIVVLGRRRSHRRARRSRSRCPCLFRGAIA